MVDRHRRQSAPPLAVTGGDCLLLRASAAQHAGLLVWRLAAARRHRHRHCLYDRSAQRRTGGAGRVSRHRRAHLRVAIFRCDRRAFPCAHAGLSRRHDRLLFQRRYLHALRLFRTDERRRLRAHGLQNRSRLDRRRAQFRDHQFHRRVPDLVGNRADLWPHRRAESRATQRALAGAPADRSSWFRLS